MTIKQLADLYLNGTSAPEWYLTSGDVEDFKDRSYNGRWNLLTRNALTVDEAPDAPSSYEALVADVRAHGRIQVWNGFRENAVVPGHGMIVFRQWHDAIHYLTNSDFSLKGEASVAWVQNLMFTDKPRLRQFIISETVLPAAAYTVYGPEATATKRYVKVPRGWLEVFDTVGLGALDLDLNVTMKQVGEGSLAQWATYERMMAGLRAKLPTVTTEGMKVAQFA